ncbi:MAG: DUF2207 family protein [Nocardioidaceae bacterium]
MSGWDVAVGGVACALALTWLAVEIGWRGPYTKIAEGRVPPGLRPAMAAMSLRHATPYVDDKLVLALVLDLARRGVVRLQRGDDGVLVAATDASLDQLTIHEAALVHWLSSQVDRRTHVRELSRSVRGPVAQALANEGWASGLRRAEPADSMVLKLAVALIGSVMVMVTFLPSALALSGESGVGAVALMLGRVGASLVTAAALITIAAAVASIGRFDRHLAVTRRGLRCYNDLARLRDYLAGQVAATADWRGTARAAVRVVRELLPWVVAFGLLDRPAMSDDRRRALLAIVEDDDRDTEGSEGGQSELDEDNVETPDCADEVAAVREVCQPASNAETETSSPRDENDHTGPSYDWSDTDGFDHDWNS